MAGVIARAGEREPAQVLVTEVESALSRIPPARIRTKAGLGFDATTAPNTTSSLAAEGRNLDWARSILLIRHGGLGTGYIH